MPASISTKQRAGVAQAERICQLADDDFRNQRRGAVGGRMQLGEDALASRIDDHRPRAALSKRR